MACVHHLPRENDMEKAKKEIDISSVTLDGTVDRHGRPAIRGTTGKWIAGTVILLNQGLATLAFFGVGVNLVLFLTRVIGQENAEAANNVSKWTGTVYIFSLVGAFLSESYWGRFKTCVIFQLIFILGLSSLSITSHFFLVAPKGCGGNARYKCRSHSGTEITLFYLCIYLVALGNGGYQPNIATFGADQFDRKDDREELSKVAFFSYFYLAMNLGSLFSNTVLGYFEDEGLWVFGFWMSTASAVAALALFLLGIPRYRHFRQSGNPVSRLCQVFVAATKKWRVSIPKDGNGLYEVEAEVMHTKGFKFLDRAAYLSPRDVEEKNPWEVCPISQVEEVKCILRLLPIWLCTILYSVVFTQMASLFVEQGAAMRTNVKGFRVPPSSMSSFDILSVTCFVFIYRRVIHPVVSRVKKKKSGGGGEGGKGGSGNGLSELQRMGIGLVVAVMAMVAAATVECYRLRNGMKEGSSSLSILWQIPQYSLIGVSEVFMYVSQLEFFNQQAPDGLKSFGSALCMTSISLGNYVSSLLVSMVNDISRGEHTEGWISGNLNKGHLERFFFLLALLTTVDLIIYIVCAKWYKCIKLHSKYGGEDGINQNLDVEKMKEIELLSSSS